MYTVGRRLAVLTTTSAFVLTGMAATAVSSYAGGTPPDKIVQTVTDLHFPYAVSGFNEGNFNVIPTDTFELTLTPQNHLIGARAELTPPAKGSRLARYIPNAKRLHVSEVEATGPITKAHPVIKPSNKTFIVYLAAGAKIEVNTMVVSSLKLGIKESHGTIGHFGTFTTVTYVIAPNIAFDHVYLAVDYRKAFHSHLIEAPDPHSMPGAVDYGTLPLVEPFPHGTYGHDNLDANVFSEHGDIRAAKVEDTTDMSMTKPLHVNVGVHLVDSRLTVIVHLPPSATIEFNLCSFSVKGANGYAKTINGTIHSTPTDTSITCVVPTGFAFNGLTVGANYPKDYQYPPYPVG